MNLSATRWISLNSHADTRGILTAVEGGKDIPFNIMRVFYMHKIDTNFERGGHAHRDTEQVIIPISGKFKVDLSDGKLTNSYELSDATKGLYMPKMIWARLYDFSVDAICLVLASSHYEMSNSLRTWDDYLAYIAKMAPNDHT